jgi:hypothetical protein
MTDDFIMTIDSGDEDAPVPSTSQPPKGKRKVAEMGDETVALDPSFSFDLTGDAYADIFYKEATFQDVVKIGSKPVSPWT